jgi:hypothetical protein
MQADITDPKTSIAIPRAALYCMVCGWTGDRHTVHIPESQNTLECPACRDMGKLEPPSSVSDLGHMVAATSRTSIEERRKVRKARRIDTPDWLDNMERHIIKSKARGAEMEG